MSDGKYTKLFVNYTNKFYIFIIHSSWIPRRIRQACPDFFLFKLHISRCAFMLSIQIKLHNRISNFAIT